MKSDDKICVVLLCNAAFFGKMLYTLSGIRSNGYLGDVCIVIGDDLKNNSLLSHLLLTLPKTFIKHFNDFKFDQKFVESFYNMDRAPHWKEKIFQFHKFHVFDTYFKNWDYIFYIDSGAHIFGNIQPIINVRKEGKFLAHSDAYPIYEWRLSNQFDQTNSLFQIINQKFDMNVDYPQTTIMLFDTKIIKDQTVKDLLALTNKWNFSITNDQGIIALYYTNIEPFWEQISVGDEKTWFYDFMSRDSKKDKPHIILKRV